MSLIALMKVFNGKKYDYMGSVPKDKKLAFDLSRTFNKHGMDMKFEVKKQDIKLWSRKR